ncbi:MAG: GDSL-type esterase/lipase family protein [Candidatus Limnocylindria bacterium]
MARARRTLLAVLVAAALIIGLLPAAAGAVAPPLASSMAAIGDSITQAASSGGSLGADYPANSWSTGTSGSVNSHYLRLLALNPAISGQNHNRSVSGAKVADLNAQVQQVVALQPDYLTVLIGGNDICTDTEAQMTPVADFRTQFQAAMATLSAGSPGSDVYVVSIPRVLGLWELFKGNFWARWIWSLGNICQSLLDNPTSTNSADVERRARVAQRNIDYNAVLAEVCAATPRCLWDGNAVYGTAFTASDVSGDYFHPSVSGQARLAQVSWDAGYWASGAPPANQPPTASFSFACTDLACSFDGAASSDSDGSIVSHAWAFGTDGSATGVAASHTFSSAGTYDVTLTVTDNETATGSLTRSVTVSAPPPPPPPPAGTVSLGTLSGDSNSRKGGWTATVTVTAVDGVADPVSGAAVSGSWSTGADGGCTTGATGSCFFTLNLNKKTAAVSWTLATISHATLAYDPDGNPASVEVSIARP